MNDVKPRILIVDDESQNLQVLRHILNEDYTLTFAKDGNKALELAREHLPDLILLDIMMPGLTGYDVLTKLKDSPLTRDIPVIFVTAISDVDDEAYGLELGAVDYISKPVNASIVKARVKTHLSLVKVDELNETRLEIIRRLGYAAEYKDNETGMHVIRMSHYARTLAKAAGLSDDKADMIMNAAPMHDVGKIGIPDSILLKPGKLDEKEWKVMKTHPYIGSKIIGKHKSPLLTLAAEIAYCHHEKWNGEGYPRRLKEKQIPLAARIIAIADVFDALTTQRPYKEAWPVEKAISLIQEESGKHFDPDLVPLFVNKLPELLHIKEKWKEKDAA